MPAAVLPIHVPHHPSVAPPGLGGSSVAALVGAHCPGLHAPLGVIVEHLDAQAGVWQYSPDGGASWRGIRTDHRNHHCRRCGRRG